MTLVHRSRVAVIVVSAAFAAPLLLSACGKSVGETIDDATITTRVKTALLNDPNVNATRIDVSTALGVVTLSGIVRSQAEADRAVAIARKIPGVKDVKSTLQIQPGGQAAANTNGAPLTPRRAPL